jgi:hypothetical protein
MAQAGCSKTEAVGDLLRRPPRLETPFDRPCKVTVASQLVLLRPTSAGMSRPMRPRCPVACHAAIAGDLTAERGRWPAETSRDRAQALFGHTSPRQLLAFLDAEASTRHLATTSWELCCCSPPRCCNDQLRAGVDTELATQPHHSLGFTHQPRRRELVRDPRVPVGALVLRGDRPDLGLEPSLDGVGTSSDSATPGA